jgi:F-type H+-transporting ATPase subunit epsilon
MAEGQFWVQVVTPEQALFEGLGRSVVLRSSEGDLTVLNGHTPLVTDVVPGEVRIEQESETVRVAVHGGFLQVERTEPGNDGGEGSSPGTRATILAGVAERADQIDVGRAERAHNEAVARIDALGGVGATSRGTPDSHGAAEGDQASMSPELAEAVEARLRAEVRLAVASGVGSVAAMGSGAREG